MWSLIYNTSAKVVQHASRLNNAFTEKGAFVVLVKISSVDGKDMLKPNTDSKINLSQLPQGWAIEEDLQFFFL